MKQANQLKLWLIGVLIGSGVVMACQPITPLPSPTPSSFPGAEYNERGLQNVRLGELAQAQRYFRQAIEAEPSNPDYWNNLCWFGSLAGHAAEVIDACSQAVELYPEAGYIRDSRGLAFALTGNYERAINDFKFFVNWSKENRQFEYLRSKREAWIVALQAGRNPFDQATLQELLSE